MGSVAARMLLAEIAVMVLSDGRLEGFCRTVPAPNREYAITTTPCGVLLTVN